MSTLQEIQEAVSLLPFAERQALGVWMESQYMPPLLVEEEMELLRSLNEAVRDMDQGRGTPVEEVRRLVQSWAGQ